MTHQSSAPPPLAAWLREGWRSAFLRTPDWRLLQTTPGLTLALLAADLLLALLFERLYINGPARLYWPGLISGWLSTAVAAWVCWLLVPRPAVWRGPGSAAALFTLMVAQLLPLTLLCGTVFVMLERSGELARIGAHPAGRWAVWLWPVIWTACAQLNLVWRGTVPRRAVQLLASVLLVGTMLLEQWAQPPRRWHAEVPAESGPEPLALTQELMELQPQLLQETLRRLQAQRPGVVDVYSITFAPYAEEDVFRRESAMVAGVMEQRFGAYGRSVQLVNHRDSAQQFPWATPANLQRTINAMVSLMDPNEDVLFIHLTSHGARNGLLATEFPPLTLEAVTPQVLRQWLDQAGVHWRIVSISACYSGSWIEPLATPTTLVMTAADAEHTSYGCGRGSELTFFGRAMFDEELRKSWSFEEAHAAARKVIDQREREAGKSDGYSNPQIRIGSDARARLDRLARERARNDTQ